MPSKLESYRESFNSSVAERALQLALENRKFEIGLYWQRAAYFWALIAATFAGYLAVLSSDKNEEKYFYAFVLSCIGLIFSLAWFLVNRGSKFWQENWENHVDMLEDAFSGPLYKTILRRPPAAGFIEKWIDGPAAISVSKVNQWVSLFTLLTWLVLAIKVLPEFDLRSCISIKHATVAGITLIIAGFMLSKTATNLTEHKHSMVVKRVSMIDD